MLEDLRSSRRRFLRRAGTIAIASLPLSRQLAMAGSLESQALAPSRRDTPAATSFVANRAPLQPSAFYPLPLGTVRPTGWLRDQLQIQASGLSGHLDETWADVGPNSGWLGGTGESWERGPYFLDGLVPLAYLLDDARLKAKAQKYIDWTLTHQAPDGMIGPTSNNDWWPRMVMLKVLDAIPGSHRRSARHPRPRPLFLPSARSPARTPAARLGQIPLAG